MNNMFKILFSCLLTSSVLLTNTHAIDDQENGFWQGLRQGVMRVMPGMGKTKVPMYNASQHRSSSHDENRAPVTENIQLKQVKKELEKSATQKFTHHTRPFWQRLAFLSPIVVRFPHLKQSFFEQSDQKKFRLALLLQNPRVSARCKELWRRGIEQKMILWGKTWDKIADEILQDEENKERVNRQEDNPLGILLNQSNNEEENNKNLATVSDFLATAPVEAADDAGTPQIDLNTALSKQAHEIVLASRLAAEKAEAARIAEIARVEAEKKEIEALLPRIRALSTHPAYESYTKFMTTKGTGFTPGTNVQEYWDTVWAPVAEAARIAEIARVEAEKKEIEALLPRIRALSTHPAYESYTKFMASMGTGFTPGTNVQEYWDTVWAPVAEAARIAEIARVEAEKKEIEALLPRIRSVSTHPAYESYTNFMATIGTGFTPGMNVQEYWHTVWAPVAEEKAARLAAEEAAK